MGVRIHSFLRVPILLLMAMNVVLAQESIHQPQPIVVQDTLRQTTMGFERVLNTFLWNGGLTYAGTFNGVSFSTQQSVRSRLIRADQRSTQDEYTAHIQATSRIEQAWKVVMQLHSSALADNRLLDLGRLAQHQALTGLEYDRENGVTVGALGGYEYNAQGDEQDGGFSYLLRGAARNVQFENFLTNVVARSSQSFLNPRRQRDDSVLVSLDRNFGSNAQNLLSVRFNNQRREFYTAADSVLQKQFDTNSNIFRREAQVLDITDVVRYRTARNVQLTLSGGVSNRTIDRGFRYKDFSAGSNTVLDTRVNEFQLFGSLDMNYRLQDAIEGMVEIAYREREERHEVTEETGASLDLIQRQKAATRRLGNISRQTILRSQQTIDISGKDQLNLVGSASILRYDTPDTLNIDDRDELLVSFGVEEMHTASQYLRVTLSADAVLNHLVYLHRLQSANNNWNRIIRFSPKVEYTPVAWFRTTNAAEVLANYTVYDFEDQVALVRSFSFRQASWLDSTVVHLTPALALEFVGTVRIYERGILKWKEFKERPENYFLERSFWPQLTARLGSRVQIGVGYRYFSQDRYKYVAAERVFERRLETSGPTAFLHWSTPESHELSIQGWRETQQEAGRTVRSISNIFMKLRLAL